MEKEKKDKQVNIRLSEKEYFILKGLARTNNMTITDYIRHTSGIRGL